MNACTAANRRRANAAGAAQRRQIDLAKILLGQSLPLTLTFAKAGNISITVPIQAVGATHSGSMSGMGGMQGKKPGSTGNMEMK